MITLKEYANTRGISYEAVRQSLKRHGEELTGHTYKNGRATCLDDYAVEILDKYRTPKTMRVNAEEIESNKEYVSELQDKIIILQDKIIELEKNAHKAIEAQIRVEMLNDTTATQKGKIEALESDLRASEERLRTAENENSVLRSQIQEQKSHPVKNLFNSLFSRH